MHVVAPVVVSWPVAQLQGRFTEWQEENAQHVIEQAQKTLHASLGESGPPEVRTEVLHSHIVPALVDASKEAQMVVLGSRGMGALGRLLLGSGSSGLVHHAHCPVAVVHSDGARAPDYTSPVLLGIDGSPASQAATALAFDEASRRGWTWWRCTRGAMSVSSRSSVWIGRSTKTKDMKHWPNASRVGKSSIPT